LQAKFRPSFVLLPKIFPYPPQWRFKMGKLIEIFGKKIRRLRRNQDLTQEKLSELSGLSLQYIGEIERGKRNPSLSSIEKLADALEYSVCDLFDFEEFEITSEDVRNKLIQQIKQTDEKKLFMLYAMSRVIFG
jgi:transcriptional regulator with XRE-family HTH domain